MEVTTPARTAVPEPSSPDARRRPRRNASPKISGYLLPPLRPRPAPDTCVLENDSVVCVQAARLPFAQIRRSPRESKAKILERERHLARYAAIARVQCSGLSHRRKQAHLAKSGYRKASTLRTPGGSPIRCSAAARSRAAWRSRLGATLIRGNGDRRWRPRHQSQISRLPPTFLCRHSAHRGFLRRHHRYAGSDGRKIDERESLQSRGGRARQRPCRRHRHPLHRSAVQAGPAVAAIA